MFNIIHTTLIGSLIATNLMLPVGNIEKSLDAFAKTVKINQVQTVQLDGIGIEIDKMLQSTSKTMELKKLQYINSKQSERAMLEVEISTLQSQIDMLLRLKSNINNVNAYDKLLKQSLKARIGINTLAD